MPRPIPLTDRGCSPPVVYSTVVLDRPAMTQKRPEKGQGWFRATPLAAGVLDARAGFTLVILNSLRF
jgi:hypothetical protein